LLLVIRWTRKGRAGGVLALDEVADSAGARVGGALRDTLPTMRQRAEQAAFQRPSRRRRRLPHIANSSLKT
jgi:hypothetical protein